MVAGERRRHAAFLFGGRKIGKLRLAREQRAILDPKEFRMIRLLCSLSSFLTLFSD
jgi:hypothetical protein